MIRRISEDARRGLWVWVVYGVIELALGSIFQQVFGADVVVPAWQFRLILMPLMLYAVVGMILGVASGAVLTLVGRYSAAWHYAAALLTLVMSFIINLALGWPIGRSAYVSFAVAVALAALLSTSLISSRWLARTAFLRTPWTISLLLLSGAWLAREVLPALSYPARLTGALLAPIAIGLGAAAWSRRHLDAPGRMWRQAALAACAITLWSFIALRASTPLGSAAENAGMAGRGKCNVLLITMDTVRADHLSVYGYDRDTTPNLRDFAREATVYERATAVAGMTLPTHASIFTGVYPSWHGAHTDPSNYPLGRPLGLDFPTLAEVLRADGYWTAAIAANHAYLQRAFGMDRGFAVYDVHRPIFLSLAEFYLRESVWRLLRVFAAENGFYELSLRAADINARAFKVLEEGRNRTPFFLFLNYVDAHSPYAGPPAYNTQFPGRDPHFDPREYDALKRTVNDNAARHISDSERNHLLSQYDGSIRYLDREIGSLLKRLRERDLYDNTLIVITADHGEGFGEKDYLEHGNGLIYQFNVHVPLVVKYPHQRGAARSSMLVSQVDLMPTVLDITGSRRKIALQGQSLRASRSAGAAVYAEGMATGSAAMVAERFRGARRAIFWDSWELNTWTEGPPQLFDLSRDPAEARDLLSAEPGIAEDLARRLDSWAAAAPRRNGSPSVPAPQTIERLRSLGYLE